ncbi:hypothetical protein OKW21_004821 [Catalinimonas alkaloidigena]|uniref:Kelch repeat-containing protein n=1 Tax=Catalinimonas alkaloidigena TaxID=1075417 RepID=UPI0024065A41|nr:hypothetical protein [Catalinimonas alkaloidigena]MDF9799558.1 hypothetical protein [Catalinimonas alkaloidigena]
MSKHLILLALISISLISCHEDEVNEPEIKVNLSGYVQKGPFLNGSTVMIIELDDALQPSGRTFSTEVQDNQGTFSFSDISLISPYVQVVGEGFYYNEVKGEASSAPLTLKALVDITDKSTVNLNVLLHLQRERVSYLIEQGKSFEEAKTQAMQEIIHVFGIEKNTVADAEMMDISKEGDDHAILLAVSATLQGRLTVAELSELLAGISTDVKEDGKLDSEAIQEKIRAGATYASAGVIRENLTERYKALGTDITLPDFEKYLDSDGDGIINSEDDEMPEAFAFTPVTKAKMDTFYVSETIMLEGLPHPAESWLSGAGARLIVNGEEKENGIALSEGDEIAIKLPTGDEYSTTHTAELTVGKFTTQWTVTTAANPLQTIGYPGHSEYSLTTFVWGNNLFAGLGEDIGFAARKEWYAYDTNDEQWGPKANFPGNADVNIRLSAKDKFYAGLGENGQAIWQYDPVADTWTAIADFPGQATTYFTYASGSKWYAGLGDNGNALWEYDPATNTWSAIADFPAGASAIQTFTIHDKVFASLTFQESGKSAEIWQFDTVSKSWKSVGNAEASNFLFAIDEKGYFARENSSELLSFSPATASWTTVTTLPQSKPKFGFSMQGKGYLYFDTDFKNSLYAYDLASNTITQIKGIEQESRIFTFAVTAENYAILCTSVSTAMGSSFYRFSP